VNLESLWNTTRTYSMVTALKETKTNLASKQSYQTLSPNNSSASKRCDLTMMVGSEILASTGDLVEDSA
jgi:hypothetical protein